MNYKQLFGIGRKHAFIFALSNYCNLHCEKCSGTFNFPIDPDSPHVHRRTKWDMPVSDVELFCELFKGYGETDRHRLTGGEPTALPMEHLEEIIEVFSSYNRLISIITNGYNLMGISRDTINKIGIIKQQNKQSHLNLLKHCGWKRTRFLISYIIRKPESSP